MKINIHARHKHAHPFQLALDEGFRKHGLDVVWPSVITECDIAVVWSWNNPAIIKQQKQSGGRVLVMEAGYVGDRLQTCSLGFDGLNGKAKFPKAPNSDRWNKLYPDELSPWKEDGEYILLMGQMPGDMSIKGLVDIEGWYAESAEAVKDIDDDIVCFRPHPLAVERGYKINDVPGTITINRPLDSALRDARACVTYNSSSAVEAVLAGVPTWSCDEGSMAYGVTGHDLTSFPPVPDRAEWCANLAYCQWTREELASGEAWENLKTIL